MSRTTPSVVLRHCMLLLIAPAALAAQVADTAAQTPGALKQLTIEQLLDVQVTSVSRHAEPLSAAASAVQVITGEEIRRSGATNLPQALRLATNLQVEQANTYDWAVTARGFNTPDFTNSPRANKMLVLIDGRTVYTPLFSGVLWDAQTVLLEDIDRIEVISGPGGALWGANAVNGVINIITKRATATLGGYAGAAGGSQLKDHGAARYGVRLGRGAAIRFFAQRMDRDHTERPDTIEATDKWHITHGGFRADWTGAAHDNFTLQGDDYGGGEGVVPSAGTFDGQNLLGRWTHDFADNSQLRVQAYADRTWRSYPGVFSEDLRTYDIDAQHQFAAGTRHLVVWGGGFRLMNDRVGNGLFVLDPPVRTMHLADGFVQDQIAIVPERVLLTLGTKLEHNSFTGFEFEPSVRGSWTPGRGQTFWGAVSRSVRSPSRSDRDFSFPIAGFEAAPAFESERVTAYELGYRSVPTRRITLSVSGFINEYTRLRSFYAGSAPRSTTYGNGLKGTSTGAEISATYQPVRWWRLRAGYIHIHTDLTATDSAVLVNTAAYSEANDPANQVMIHSIMDLSHHLQFDVVARAVAELPGPHVPGYQQFDARLAWQAGDVEFAVIGQNLAAAKHAEFGVELIPRSVIGRVAVRW